jgi:hypothetical protein
MGIGLGLILIAEGALFAWAVDASTAWSHAQTAGYVLLAIGALALFLSLVYWSTWVGAGYFARSDRATRN